MTSTLQLKEVECQSSLRRVVIRDVYRVGVDFDPDRCDQPRSALQGHQQDVQRQQGGGRTTQT